MVSINHNSKEINCKIVYYGPGLGGKTTNLQVIHKKVPKTNKSEMVSLATESDRTLFFDYLPLELGKIKGFDTKFQLYTVPGQVYYNETRKLVLRGVDGIVFVADSQRTKLQETLDSYENLKENLSASGLSLDNIPHVIQYNKRDFDDVISIEELESKVNKLKVPYFEAIAIQSNGVFTTLKSISKSVINKYNQSSGTSASGSKFKKKTDTPNKKESPKVDNKLSQSTMDVDEDVQKFINAKNQRGNTSQAISEDVPKIIPHQKLTSAENEVIDEDVQNFIKSRQKNVDSPNSSPKADKMEMGEPGPTKSEGPIEDNLKKSKSKPEDPFINTSTGDDFNYTPDNPGYTGLSDELSEENSSFLDIKPYTGYNEGDLPAPDKPDSKIDFDSFGESSSNS